MGAYLNKPITEKESESGEGEGLKYGATCMQGWRVSQEDAHNCHIKLAEDWSLFAVYDGHGGGEVSKYTALNFPEFLKNKEFWKQEDLVETLKTAFVDFDDHIRSEAVMKELAKIANVNKEKPKPDHDSDDENDRIQTIEESQMPLEQILARYGYSLIRKAGDSNNLFIGPQEDDEEEGKAKEKKKRHSKSPAQSQAKRAKTDSDNDAAEEGKTEEPAEKAENSAEDGDKNETEDGPATAKASAAGSASESAEKVDSEDSDDESDVDFEEGDEDDEDEEEAEDEDEEEGEAEEIFFPGGAETPGEDSGTTACVCLISKTKIVVANAGDSRAVLSRGGVALDLSVDHKPEDECERVRIEKAGGCVNADGRVNGGLNLSRALGDHCYKKNADIKLEEQMISALPDVKIEELKPEDDFVVVACDGIWNSMESQDVVDFVKAKFEEGKSCQTIAEELCDNCMADSTAGDGTGCDNMTVIITQISH